MIDILNVQHTNYTILHTKEEWGSQVYFILITYLTRLAKTYVLFQNLPDLATPYK